MTNQLYPIFLKLDQLNLLVVGGGGVALEKLQSIFNNSPNARVALVAHTITESELHTYINNPLFNIQWKQELFNAGHIDDVVVVIAATEDANFNQTIYTLAKQRQRLVNVADTPHLCDFYLGAIVSKGDLKLAISTNGKSPTFAKRFKQVLEDILPDDTQDLINNLHRIRNQLSGNFASKVKKMKAITQGLIE